MKTPTYKEIQKNWPDGVDFSLRRVRMIKKLLKEKKPGWLKYTSSSSDFLRLFIRDNVLKFKPREEEFDCEKIIDGQFLFGVGYNRYRIPAQTGPKGAIVNFCGGGFMNIRKLILED